MHAPKKHELPIRTDEHGAPIIVKVSNHLVTLERMVRFRAEALVEQAETPAVLFHYAREKSALQASIACLRYHRAVMQRLPEPMTLLRQLVEHYDSATEMELAGLIEQARQLCATYPANEEMLAHEGAYPGDPAK